MKRIINQRPGILILPESKLIIKPKTSISVEEISDEVQKAITKGWLKLEDDIPETSEPTSSVHDWDVNYSRVEENLVTITDKTTGKSVTGEILEKKGTHHFVLKDIGTVKKNQFCAKAQALEQFDATE